MNVQKKEKKKITTRAALSYNKNFIISSVWSLAWKGNGKNRMMKKNEKFVSVNA